MTHVLIVDDEPLLREELQESLELEDFEVTTATSVPDALEKLEQDRVDAVVTDLKMPKLGGLELIRQLQADGFEGTVVVVSGHGAQSSRDDAMSMGATACFAKPLDTDDLIDVLRPEG